MQQHKPDGVLTLYDVPFQGTRDSCATGVTSLDYNSPREIFSWAIPGSLAVTRGILVSFFSSAY